MRRPTSLLLGGLFTLGLMLARASAQDLSLWVEPPDGWVYTFAGDQAESADDGSLDGSWSHNNGSDAWDGSAIGEGSPGGVSALEEAGETFIRMQDPGDLTRRSWP